MTLISRLFKKKSTAKSSPAKKEQVNTVEQSIKQLDQMSADDIVNVAVGNQDIAVRIVAISKLPYGETLKSLALSNSASKIQVSARERIASLVDNNVVTFEQLNTDIGDKVALLAIASFSDQVELQERVLDNANDHQLLYKISLEGASVKLRQIAAKRMSDRDSLEKLLKQSKGKDKTVYRIVKEKCDAFKEQDKQKQQLKLDVESLCHSLERLSKRAFDPMFNANFSHLCEQWNTLESNNDSDITAELKPRISAALQACENIVEEQQRIQQEQEQKQRAINSAVSNRESVLTSLRQLLRSLYLYEDNEVGVETDVAGVLEESEKQWNDSTTHVAASEQQKKHYRQLQEAVKTVREQIAESGSLNQQFQPFKASAEDIDSASILQLRKRMNSAYLLDTDDLPELLIAIKAWLANWDQKQQEEKNHIQQLNRQIGGLIRRASDAIERGQVRQAVGIHRSIEQKLVDLKHIPAGLTDQLERLNEKLNQLQDWRSYAVQPKIEELVEQMRALINSALNPDLLAEKIKALQDQWKQLSKGGGSQYQEQWDHFHELAQAAYEPCKQHFLKQADVRQKNLEKRKNLVTQLKDFFSHYDWDNADWKMVEKMIRVARQEWREYSPTDRSATKDVQQAFNLQLDNIQQHLDIEYKKNAQLKQQLIEQARLLSENEDSRSSVEDIKKLQASWKSIGVVSRKADQSLWQEFRVHCDSVFEKRQLQSDQFKAQLNASKEEAENLCEKIKALSTFSGKELLDARDKLETLKTEFHALGTIPKNSINTINSLFSESVEHFERKIVLERRQAKEKVWSNLFDANTAIIKYELSLISGDTGDVIKSETQTLINAMEQWPKGGKEAIEKKFNEVSIDSGSAFEVHEALLRQLCIRMEILAETETPESDQKLRMDYQVQRLQQGLGQKVLSNDVVLSELILEWIAVPSVPLKIYEELLERFNTSRQQVV